MKIILFWTKTSNGRDGGGYTLADRKATYKAIITKKGNEWGVSVAQ